MIRRALNIQIELATIQKNTTTANSGHASQYAAEKLRFKRRLFLLFGSLFGLDMLDIVGNVFGNLSISNQSTSLLYVLSQTITVPFYIPLHILILFALLDSFKEEVLKKREVTKSSSSAIASRKSASHDTRSIVTDAVV